MGQYWQFINIDRRNTTGCLGKMGEFFCAGDPTNLIKHIAVPVIPLTREYSLDIHRMLPGSWAGCRLICLGDYARRWPKGVVTQSDFPWENEGYVSDSDSECRPSYDERLPGRTPEAFMSRCKSVESAGYGWDTHLAYPCDRVWVLRNLSKKIFVRSNGLPTANEDGQFSYEYHQGIDGHPGLGQVLVANIGWSNDSTINMCVPDNEDLSRGAWAGDRFEVRLFEDVEQVMTAEGWVDETRKEAERLYHIWIHAAEFEEIEGGFGEFPEEPEQIFD